MTQPDAKPSGGERMPERFTTQGATRRIYLALTFLFIALCVIGAGHWYVARRLGDLPGIEPPLDVALGLLVGLLGVLAIAPRIARRLLGVRDLRFVAWIGAIWMGFFFYLLHLFGASDLLLLVLGVGRAPHAATQVVAVSLAALALVAGGLLSVARGPYIRRVEVELERWPRELDGFRITQITDLHLSLTAGRGFAEKVTRLCNATDPDLIAVTGDLVDGGIRELSDAVAPLSGLRARYGVFFVTGNHEHYAGAKKWARKVTGLGMRVLRNQHVTIGDGEAKFHLAGTNDRMSGQYRAGGGEDLPAALEGIDPDSPVLLLAHNPETFEEAAARGVDLQLSGHTHGGQLFPFQYLVRLRTRFIAGFYRLGNSRLYVSRGTGYWGPPMRVLAPSEITVLILKPLARPAEGLS